MGKELRRCASRGCEANAVHVPRVRVPGDPPVGRLLGALVFCRPHRDEIATVADLLGPGTVGTLEWETLS